MSDLFNNVKPGDMVHYKTPQGQHGKGKVVLRYDTHVVVNRGKGQPQVVNDKNYVKHERGGKVIGALLSRLKEAKVPQSFAGGIEDHTPIVPHAIGPHVLRNKTEHEYTGDKVEKYVKHVNSRFKRDDDFRKKVLSKAKGGNAGRDFLYRYAHEFYDSLPKNEEVEQIDEISKKTKDSYIAKRGSQLSSFLYGSRRGVVQNAMTGRQQKNAVHGLKRATGKPVGLNAIASFAKESHNLPRTGEDEISDPPVKAVYPKMPELEKKFLSAAKKRKFKDAAATGNPRDFAKEDTEQLAAQKAALTYKTKVHQKKKKHTLKTMKESLIKELDNSTLASYVTKALDSRKKNARMADMAHRIHTPERAKYFADKAARVIAKRSAGIKQATGKIASNLPHEPLAAHTAGEKSKHGGWGEVHPLDRLNWESVEMNEVSAPGKEEWIKANKARFIERYGKEKGLRVLYAKAWKDSKTNEAKESEYMANLHMGGKAARREPGHYLTRDGRTLSGPHSPSDAVRKYKDMSDNQNVKIVHVKEATENPDKAKKAASKAIALVKGKKKGQTANVEPELHTPQQHTSQPMLQGAEGVPQNVRI